jgi:hypothetical protein
MPRVFPFLIEIVMCKSQADVLITNAQSRDAL